MKARSGTDYSDTSSLIILKMTDIRAFLLLCIFNLVYSQRNPCPCQKPEWCKPVTTPPGKEVYVFSVNNKNWHDYDWNKITTIVQYGYYDPALLCFAHSKGKRVITNDVPQAQVVMWLSESEVWFTPAKLENSDSPVQIIEGKWKDKMLLTCNTVDYPAKDLPRQDLRSVWIAKQVQNVKDNFLDGINIDFEEPIPKDNTTLRDGLTSLVKETSAAFKKFFNGSQLSFDVPWSPDCIYGRCFDYLQLAQHLDFLFIMAYDIFGPVPGIAGANSPYNNTMFGVQRYLTLGITAQKLVLGLPWYGYHYTCINITQENKCFFVGGKEFEANYAIIVEQYLKASKSGRMWDTAAKSPYFSYQDKKTKKWYQVWYDDPESLKYKYDLGAKFDLRGVGMWQADTLNYTDSKEAIKERNAMWGALSSYKIT